MANPWLKKNPFMSLWVSAANRMAGSVRGYALSQAKRQAAAATNEVRKETVKLWTDALSLPSAKTKPKRKR